MAGHGLSFYSRKRELDFAEVSSGPGRGRGARRRKLGRLGGRKRLFVNEIARACGWRASGLNEKETATGWRSLFSASSSRNLADEGIVPFARRL